MKAKKVLGLVLALSTAAAAITGCGAGGNENISGADDTGAVSGQTSSGQDAAQGQNETSQGQVNSSQENFTYPMEATTLTINYTSDGSDIYDNSDMADWCKDRGFQKNLQEATGVTLSDVGGSPATFDTSEEFLLMLASNDYPDIIYANWVSFPGGPEAALNDGYIYDLMDYQQYLPNLMAYLDENPDIKQLVLTDSGALYCAPYVKDEDMETTTGLVVRQDWLDQTGKEVPRTPEEMYDVLRAFKNEMEAASPLTFECRWLFLEYAAGSLSSAWNTCYPFYIENDTVQYGPMTQNYKEFITEMAKWYKEGLIDVDIATVDKSTVQAKFSNGESGVAIQQIGNVENCTAANEGTDYAVSAAPSLVSEAGEEPQFSQFTNKYDGSFGFSVSTQCSDIEAACRWLDYFYSEEGSMLINFGLEGVTYEMADGRPQFTDLILNNPETPNSTTARSQVGHYRNWPHAVEDSALQYPDSSKAILSTWKSNMREHSMPTVTYTAEESDTLSALYNDIDTYSREMITKFLLGTEDIANWDSFTATLKGMGIDKVLEIRQAAYERYCSR